MSLMAKLTLTDYFNQFTAFVERDSGLMTSGLVLEEFSSKNPAHRLNIRLGIVEGNVLTEEENKNILDLSQIPKAHAWHFSISHSDFVGGYVQSDQVLGMDIERSERVLRKTIQRVSSEKEIAESPGPDYLWTAKEAIFKSLSLDVMSQATVSNWKTCDFPQTFKFHCLPPPGLKLKHNLGYSQRILDHNWTVFFF